MVLDVHDQVRNINYLEACGCNCHSVTPWPNTRKRVEAGIVGGHAGAGVTINVYQLYLSTRYVQPGRIYDLSRKGRSFGLCPSEGGNEHDQ